MGPGGNRATAAGAGTRWFGLAGIAGGGRVRAVGVRRCRELPAPATAALVAPAAVPGAGRARLGGPWLGPGPVAGGAAGWRAAGRSLRSRGHGFAYRSGPG